MTSPRSRGGKENRLPYVSKTQNRLFQQDKGVFNYSPPCKRIFCKTADQLTMYAAYKISQCWPRVRYVSKQSYKITNMQGMSFQFSTKNLDLELQIMGYPMVSFPHMKIAIGTQIFHVIRSQGGQFAQCQK